MQIKINDKLINYIESLQYEKDRTNEIMAFMLSHDYDMNTDAFKKWDHDNQVDFVKYQEAKNEIENKYIKNNPKLHGKNVNWKLDFKTQTLTVSVVNAKKD